jgi:CBS-domain-containing membrane protein
MSLLLMTEWSEQLWIMAPFGASCVLAFGLWDAPLSQPRNIIGGHLIHGRQPLELFGYSSANWQYFNCVSRFNFQ